MIRIYDWIYGKKIKIMMMMTQVVQCEEGGPGSSFTLNFVFCPDRRVSLNP